MREYSINVEENEKLETEQLEEETQTEEQEKQMINS